jgi:hypothetical protein
MSIVGYKGDGVCWCSDCAAKRYGKSQVGELFVLDEAGDQVLPIPDPGSALHRVTFCAGGCGASIPVPRARPTPLSDN